MNGKKILMSLALGALFVAGASAQTNYTIQRACHPDDVKEYTTEQLRSRFAMEKVMEENVINLTYSMYDRLVFGGVVPVGKTVKLETIAPLKSTYFLERREFGVINIGGPGIVHVYLGHGRRKPRLRRHG